MFDLDVISGSTERVYLKELSQDILSYFGYTNFYYKAR